MSDLENTPPPAESQSSNGITDEIRMNAAMAFGDPSIAPPAPPVNDSATPPDPAARPAAEGGQPAATPPPENEVVEFDEGTYLKNEFGFETLEEAKSKIEAWKKLETTPPEHKFADEDAKKLYAAIVNKDTKTVFNYLHAQQLAAEFADKPADEKLKQYLRATNPLYEKADIDFKYGQLYSVNEDKFKDSFTEEVDQQSLRLAQLDAKQRMADDLAKAEAYFQQHAKSYELPVISAPATSVDERYEAWKKQQDAIPQLNAEAATAYSNIKPEDIKFESQFKDEARKIDYTFGFVPDQASLDASKLVASDVGKFLEQFYKPDRSPDRNAWMRLVYIHQNIDKILTQAHVSAIDEYNRARIANRGESTYGRGQFTADLPEGELEAHMNAAFSVPAGR